MKKSEIIPMLKKIFRVEVLSLIVAIIGGIIIGGLGVYKAFVTTDAGKVMEKIYQEAKSDLMDTQQLITEVQLPDSLENSNEVQRLRTFQNKVYIHYLLYLSICKAPHFYSEEMNESDGLQQYERYINLWNESLICLSQLDSEISKEYEKIMQHFVLINDSVAARSYNFFTFMNELHCKKEFNDELEKLKTHLSEKQNNALDYKMELMLSEKLYESYLATHKYHVMCLTTVNIRLMNIKNQYMKNRYGDFEDVEAKSISMPPFLQD